MTDARHPFRQFVLKVHSRCDLACDHCYVYSMVDQRWRGRPVAMSVATIEATAARIAEHADTHALATVDIVLHGGEPLLAGTALLHRCVATIRAAVGTGVEARFSVQTNGTRLSPEFLDLFGELGVKIGVSLDGDRAANDRHRRRADGRGSFESVAGGLALLGQQQYRHLFSGLLCTVDLRNDPIRTYEALLAFSPPAVDFLLPHANWSSPPLGLDRAPRGAPYGDWLTAVFDRWYDAPLRETRVRRFEAVMSLLLGGRSPVEGIGVAPTAHVVVETDGAIEQSDILTSSYEGAGATGLQVATDSFDAALALPSVAHGQLGVEALAADCRACPVHPVCGGGLLPHRYREGAGFMNPSVYCADLYAVIAHIRRTLIRDVAALRRSRS
jgi:uncharacterized protein